METIVWFAIAFMVIAAACVLRPRAKRAVETTRDHAGQPVPASYPLSEVDPNWMRDNP